MSDFEQLFDFGQQPSGAQLLYMPQGMLFNIYSGFNILKTSFNLVQSACELGGDLIHLLDVLLPSLKISILCIKSVFDLYRIIQSCYQPNPSLLKSHQNLLDNFIVKIADENINAVSVVKRIMMACAVLCLTALVICASSISWVCGLAVTAITILNDTVSYRYLKLAQKDIDQKIANKSAELAATSDINTRKQLNTELTELKKQKARCEVEIKDKYVRWGINSVYLLAFSMLAIPLPGLQIAATGIFIATMLGTILYAKKGKPKLEKQIEMQEITPYEKKCKDYKQQNDQQEFNWQRFRHSDAEKMIVEDTPSTIFSARAA